VPALQPADIAFKKIDSLLPSQIAAELEACMHNLDHCMLAPASPCWGRIIRGGRQFVRQGYTWRDVGVALPAELNTTRLVAHSCNNARFTRGRAANGAPTR